MDGRPRRLYRSRRGQLLGVCAGIGRYLDRDPVLVRLVWIAGSVVTGVVPGIAIYLLAWLIVPLEPVPYAARERDGSGQGRTVDVA